MMSEEEMTVEEIASEIQRLWIFAAISIMVELALAFIYFKTDILEMGFIRTNLLLPLMDMSLFFSIVPICFAVYLKHRFMKHKR